SDHGEEDGEEEEETAYSDKPEKTPTSAEAVSVKLRVDKCVADSNRLIPLLRLYKLSDTAKTTPRARLHASNDALNTSSYVADEYLDQHAALLDEIDYLTYLFAASDFYIKKRTSLFTLCKDNDDIDTRIAIGL